MSVYPSARMEQLCSLWADFQEIWFECFSKIRKKIQVSLKHNKNTGLLYTKINTHCWSYLAQFLEQEIDKTCTENKNTHLMGNNFFLENGALYEIM
jgi:hypothetical protein